MLYSLRYETFSFILRILIVSMNASSGVGHCATVFSILSPFDYPLNEAACPPVRGHDRRLSLS